MPRWIPVLYALFAAACVAALVWPVYPWVAARVDARVLGLPFPILWHVLWIGAAFLALLAFDRAARRGGPW